MVHPQGCGPNEGLPQPGRASGAVGLAFDRFGNTYIYIYAYTDIDHTFYKLPNMWSLRYMGIIY